MSSHREAPGISQDPVADNADVYAFVSPDDPSTVTILSNFVPLQGPAGGPNFFEFGDDVLYSIYIDNDGDAMPEIEYQFQFTSSVQNPGTFLYNTGPITSLDSPNWNSRQNYSVVRFDAGKPPKKAGPPAAAPGGDVKPGPAFSKGATRSALLGSNLPCPPCNIGPRSTPNYDVLAAAAVQTLGSGERVFCGQRNDPFFVDLGSIFDLGALRLVQNLHLIPLPPGPGVDATKQLNIHTIAIQVPISMLTADGTTPTPAQWASSTAVLGIWSGASRRKARVLDDQTDSVESGPWVQVSRLGNPLFNEVVTHLGQKDEWNRGNPVDDSEYLANVQHPELAGLLTVLYPNVFPNLAALNTAGTARADLVAVLLTGIPAGIIPGFQNHTGSTYADMLRLNVAIPPSGSPNHMGLLGGDLAGFPNGRRIDDDIVAIELQAIAGATYKLVAPGYTVDAAVPLVNQGIAVPTVAGGRYLATFPYAGTPYDGYHVPAA